MSTVADEMRRFHVAERTDDPEIQARQRKLLESLLDTFPEERKQLVKEAQIQEARAVLRDVLAVRGLTLGADDEVRINACTDHDTLRRWHKQAVVAPTVSEVLLRIREACSEPGYSRRHAHRIAEPRATTIEASVATR
jgi:hypothetical protein